MASPHTTPKIAIYCLEASLMKSTFYFTCQQTSYKKTEMNHKLTFLLCYDCGIICSTLYTYIGIVVTLL